MTGFKDVPAGSEEQLQLSLSNVGPVSVAIDASGMGFQMYRYYMLPFYPFLSKITAVSLRNAPLRFSKSEVSEDYKLNVLRTLIMMMMGMMVTQL